MKKKNTIKTIIATLGLSTTISLLSSCGNAGKQIYIGGPVGATTVTYNKETNLMSDSIPYKNLENGDLKIVTLEYNGKTLEPKLMCLYKYSYAHTISASYYDTIDYIDLENGITQMTYFYHKGFNESPKILLGENFTILEEISLFDFVIENNWLEDEYDINELIAFFKEKVKPELEGERELEESRLTRKCKPKYFIDLESI